MIYVHRKNWILLALVFIFPLSIDSQELVDEGTGTVATSSNPKLEVKLREKLSIIKVNIERELKLDPMSRSIPVKVVATGKGFILEGQVPNARIQQAVVDVATKNAEGIEVIDYLQLMDSKFAPPSSEQDKSAPSTHLTQANSHAEKETEPKSKTKNPDQDLENVTTRDLKKRDDKLDKVMRQKQIADKKERKQ